MRRLGGSDQHPLQHLAASAVVGLLVTGCAWTYPPRDPKVPLPKPPAKTVVQLLAEPVGTAQAKEAPFAAHAIRHGLVAFELYCHVPPSANAEFVRVVLVAPDGAVLDGKAGPALTRTPLLTSKAVCGSAVVCMLVTPYGDLRQTPPLPLVIPGCN